MLLETISVVGESGCGGVRVGVGESVGVAQGN